MLEINKKQLMSFSNKERIKILKMKSEGKVIYKGE